MKIFNLNKTYNIVCNFVSTRSGFKHIANLCKNGISIAKAKICYLNRTWECFEYESVLVRIIEANFEGKEKEKFLKAIKESRNF